MKGKITKLRGFSFVASLIMLLSLFSFSAKAQQQAPAEPIDTLFKIKGWVSPGSSQTRNYRVPAGVTKLRIQCWGAGAAGARVKKKEILGAGGGGGAYARIEEVDVEPGELLTIEIGAGGSSSSGNSKGGDTKVKRGNTVLVKAAGAPGITGNNQITPGEGAKSADCLGDYATSGGNGGAGKKDVNYGYSGAGGGAAGNAGDGQNGANAGSGTTVGGAPGASSTSISGSDVPGKGGDGVYGGYSSSHYHHYYYFYASDGDKGEEFGAGGSGASFGSNDYRFEGGNGANGAVLITYDDCNADAGAIVASASGCFQQLVNQTSASGASGTYFWEMSKDNVNWSVIPGATNDNLTPSDTAYYRRGYTTHCGTTVRTGSVHVNVGFPSPGFVALSESSSTTSLTVCKWTTVTFPLSVYHSSISQVKWQRSNDQGGTWTDMTDYQPVGDVMSVSETSVETETWYRAIYEPLTECKVPTSNQFVLKVENGVLGRPDFWFDTTTVYVTLRYGQADTNLYVTIPDYEPQGSIVVTNDKGGFVNEGRLLGKKSPGTYTIDWILQECGDPVVYTKKYVISYPACNEQLTAGDFDGNHYNTVRIGFNCWTKENLRSQHYISGDSIYGAFVYESAQYPDTANNLSEFARLYTWYAAVGIPEGSDDVPVVNIFGHTVGVCPYGWFLPDANLMAELNNYLSRDLRTTDLWLDGEGTNLTGMSTKPAGCRNGENSRFEELYGSSYFWTSQETVFEKSFAYWIDCYCNRMQLNEYNKHDAMSIRCVKENTEYLPTVVEHQPDQLSMTEAQLFGDVIDCGGLPILERGFCYGTTSMPELNDGSSLSVQNSVPTVGPYNNDINGLTVGVVYYVRAYAKNALGIAYSDQKIFSLTDKPDTITFHSNGGSSYMDPQLVLRGESTTLSKCLFTYPLSTFKGWSTTAAGSVVYADEANITTHGNVDLYAQWYFPTHTAITEVACGSYTWTSGDGNTYTSSGTYTYPHIDVHGCTQVDTLHLTINPTYNFPESKRVLLGPGEYYEWRGQQYNLTGTYYDRHTTVCCGCDSVYVLNLTVNEVVYDTVRFDNNGGQGTMPYQVWTRGIVEQLDANTFIWPMSAFKNWNTQPNGSGNTYTNQQNITTTGNMTLYAQWYHPQHQSTTVTECNFYTWVGGTGNTYTESGTQTYQHTDEHGCTQVDTLHLTIYKGFFKQETASVSATNTPYQWVGHNKSFTISGTYYDSLKTIHDCDSVYKLILNVTDSIKVTVTFNSNGGSGTMSNQRVNVNMPTALKANEFHNSFYTFVGWNTLPGGTGVSYADGGLITTDVDVTLYAQWKAGCLGTARANEHGGVGYIDSVRDHQNNSYALVEIDGQCFMRENLRTTTSPSTGNNILLNNMVQNYISKAAGYYENSTTKGAKYGVMYNWCAMMDTFLTNRTYSREIAIGNEKDIQWPSGTTVLGSTPRRGICPEGWHVPTASEWNTMTTNEGITVSSSETVTGANGVGKLTTGDDWEAYGSSAPANGYPGNMYYTDRNSTGFSALPGGYYCNYAYSEWPRHSPFNMEGQCTHFWVASNSAEVRCIYYENKHLGIETGTTNSKVYKMDASYVRCVRDRDVEE